jgi:hypothetical protein
VGITWPASLHPRLLPGRVHCDQFFVIWCLAKIPDQQQRLGRDYRAKITILGYHQFDSPASKYVLVLAINDHGANGHRKKPGALQRGPVLDDDATWTWRPKSDRF